MRDTVIEEPRDVSVNEDRYPYCLVWTPIPLLTWIFPFIGHMGICSSDGVIYDFAGPYYIGEGDLAFGKTTRYLQIHPGVSARTWDDAVAQANTCYEQKMHNICCQNCHSHCATVLDTVRFKGFQQWNMIILAAWMFFCGKFVSLRALLYSLLPSVIIWGLIIFSSIFAK